MFSLKNPMIYLEDKKKTSFIFPSLVDEGCLLKLLINTTLQQITKDEAIFATLYSAASFKQRKFFLQILSSRDNQCNMTLLSFANLHDQECLKDRG